MKTEEAPAEPVKETETPATAEAPVVETPKEEVKEEKVCFFSPCFINPILTVFIEGG